MNGIKILINELAVGKRLNLQTLKLCNLSIVEAVYGSDHLMGYIERIKGYDDYTYSHSINVAFYGMLIAKWMGMSEKNIWEITQAGLLHDIGKAKIPKKILKKKNRLTDFEFEVMKNHSDKGYQMLDQEFVGETVKTAVRMHHERLNGTGYPDGIGSQELSEYSKIIAIADVYDAMTSDRPYKKRTTPFRAFQMFATSGVEEFDFKIVRNFSEHLYTNLIGAKVVLDSGISGIIDYISLEETENPIVRIQTEGQKIIIVSGEQIVSLIG